jgi:hypothetical protein
MSLRAIQLTRAAILSLGAVLLAGTGLQAGDRALTTSHAVAQPAPAPSPRFLPPPEPFTITLAVTPPVAKEPVFVQLRGPDGNVRSFPLEGGRDAITYSSVVLRPGQSLTIHLAAAK